MRILIVSQYFWPENFRVNDFVNGLIERGHSVEVLTGVPNYPDGKAYPGYEAFKKLTEYHDSVKIMRVPIVTRGNNKLKLALNYLSFVISASIIAPYKCKKNYDNIFVYAPSPVLSAIPAIILAKIKNTGCVLWVQDIWPESVMATGGSNSKLLFRFLNIVVKLIYQNCSKILVQSNRFVPYISRYKIKNENIGYLPSWAEDNYKPVLRNMKLVSKHKLDGCFSIMFAGNVGMAQDFENILKAAELLSKNKKIKWLILGDGRMKQWVRSQIKQRKLEDVFHLLGKYPQEMMSEYFAVADVMLVSLKREPIFNLTIPAKVQSYLASGRPIVTMLDGEGSRIIEEAKAGITSPAGEPQLLVEAITKIYNMDQEQREKLGQNGLDYYNTYFSRELLLNKAEEYLMEKV